jgi:hypothetical protein
MKALGVWLVLITFTFLSQSSRRTGEATILTFRRKAKIEKDLQTG